jgi:uracil-DNA glycosylase
MAKSLTSDRGNPGPGELQRLATDIAACRICRDAPLKSPLPHEPRPVVHLSATARILIAGQAPGARVHASGLPFDDPSGDRLRDWMQVGRETFYDQNMVAIVPMGFCFPGYDKNKSDLPPRPECRAHWHDRVFAAMPQVRVFLCIGGYAHHYHLPRLGFQHKRTEGVTQTVSNWRSFVTPENKVFVLPHPSWRNTSWLKKHPWFEDELLPVLRAEVAQALE